MKQLEEYPLYNGEIVLKFDPVKHQYFVDGVLIDGCTGVLSVLNKPALIPWAVNMCVDYISKSIKPGVAIDEIAIKTMLDEAKRAHNVKRDAAGDIGTLVHNYCEQYIKGQNPSLPVNEQIRNGALAFLDWAKTHDVKFVEAERKIYSRRYRYAGTLDAEGLVDGKLAIIDFKTSSGFYDEMRFQVAAYEAARREESGNSYTRWIARFDKKTGEFEAKEFDDLEKDFAAFLGCLEAYKRLKELKKKKYETSHP